MFLFKNNLLVYFVINLLFALIFQTCSKKDSPLSAELEYGEGINYQIYSAVFNNMFSSDSSYQVVLCDSTVYGDFYVSYDNIHKKFVDLSEETFNNFTEINKKSVRLLNIPDLNIQCDLIAPEDRDQWKEIFPNANVFVHVSRIGFNSEYNQALLYISDYYAPLCGAGFLVYLEKDTSWEVKQTLMLWIS